MSALVSRGQTAFFPFLFVVAEKTQIKMEKSGLATRDYECIANRRQITTWTAQCYTIRWLSIGDYNDAM